ncbi:MAG: metallophosphoesterase family protein [Thermomicrobiales bacterium]
MIDAITARGESWVIVERGGWYVEVYASDCSAMTRIETELPAIRIAAIGDFHVKHEFPTEVAGDLTLLHERADVLVVAGDMTDNGRIVEFEMVADQLAAVKLPVIAVLGNHDRRCLRRTALRRILERGGVMLLDGQATSVELKIAPAGPGFDRPVRAGLAGVGGYGGGFWPEEGPLLPPYRAAQALALRARREALRLDEALHQIETGVDYRVAVLHYAPTSTTLGDEPLVKQWMLGNIQLAHVIDRHPVDLVIHGHAHLGNPEGATPGGTPVRNVASQVVGLPVVYRLPVTAGRGNVPAAEPAHLPGISA